MLSSFDPAGCSDRDVEGFWGCAAGKREDKKPAVIRFMVGKSTDE